MAWVAGTPQPAAETIARKIIYRANVDLIVDDLPTAEQKLDELLKRHHGLMASSEMSGTSGATRSASWRLRIPVSAFAEFVSEVAKLGEAVNNKTDSDDVTDKYFDFQVRLENKKVQVERLQKIIKDQTGKISELLEAERELGRVTTELEELKGTLKLWDNQIALTTVSVTMHERREYVATAAPTFRHNISRTFVNSLESFIYFLQTLTLIAVALTPWLPLIALIVIACWLLIRRVNHRPVVAGIAVMSGKGSPTDSQRGAP
jgi:hypothetical protein